MESLKHEQELELALEEVETKRERAVRGGTTSRRRSALVRVLSDALLGSPSYIQNYSAGRGGE